MKAFIVWLPSLKTRLFWMGIVGTLLGLFVLTILRLAGTGPKETYMTPENSWPVSSQGLSVEAEALKLQGLQGEDYFVNFRLERERYRQETKAMLQAVLNSADNTSRAEAQTQWLEISNQIAKEGEMENLLKIKGFKDVIVSYAPTGAHVVVYADKLSTDEVRLIQEIVRGATNLRLDQIIISTKT